MCYDLGSIVIEESDMGVRIVHKETGAVLWSGEGDSLRGANLEYADLTGANLWEADLRDAIC